MHVKPLKVGCARPTGARVGEAGQGAVSGLRGELASQDEGGVVKMAVMVGKPAPDFEVPGYHRGEFVTAKLSDHLGKWVLLCFYPGDFTCV